MSRFIKELTSLLDQAAKQSVIDKITRDRLCELANDRQRSSGVLSLAQVLAWLGGGILMLGLILVISANWNEISDLGKLLGFFFLFGGVQGAGIYLRRSGSHPYFAEGLNFLGAGLFLGGIGLISQIYQVEGRASTGVLIWLVAIAPMAWCLRSESITLLSVFALGLWLHLEQFDWASNYFPTPAGLIAVEVGLGVALIGFAAALRDREAKIALTFRGAGVLLLFYSAYMLGFYRHLSTSVGLDGWLICWPAVVALALGGVGLGVGFPRMLPNNRYLRDRLALLLGAILALAALMLLTDLEIVPRGADLKFFNFGWYRTFHVTEWVLSATAWILWFGLAGWCVLFASRTGRQAYLNAGVIGIGLGVITRFFDLVGGLMQTGLLFVAGGTVLLATCLAVETWRRRIVTQLKDSDQFRKGVRA